MRKNLFVDIHVLQTLPPNNINRDDSGSPKTCEFGGVTRQRVSSQAWKKAVRDDFKENLPKEEIGIRTKKVIVKISEEIQKLKPELTKETADTMATEAFKNLGFEKIKSVEDGADTLLLVSPAQIKAVAELAAEGSKDKKAYKAAFTSHPSIDLLLFGRMVAADQTLNVDASCQVSHALSTHATTTEFDYFTAVDDEKVAEADTGAGHIGVTEFTSSTMYRYATINVMQLYKKCGVEAPEFVKQFILSFIRSMPTGKENSFANRTAPYAIYVTVREDQPANFVGAFEKAVKPSENGYEKESALRLVSTAENLYEYFIEKPVFARAVGNDFKDLAEVTSIKKMADDVEEELKTLLGEE